MNGRLSEQPLAELIREISAKKLSGRLRAEQNRITVVVYFKNGEFLYAAANVRTLRLREYLSKLNLLTEEDLQSVNANRPDLELAATLVDCNLIQARTIRDVQLKQIADVLRLALLWLDGTWEFDHRSQLNEKVDFDFDPSSLFLEAARRLPPTYGATRLLNENEIFSLNESAPATTDVEPKEGFVLSRLDRPMPLKELIAVTGLPDTDALKIIYGLALSNHIVRDDWKTAFREVSQTSTEQQRAPDPPITDREEVKEVDEKDLSAFVDQIDSATTFYEVLSIAHNVSAFDLKQSYYDLARRYHPDRFRRKDLGPLQDRLESAFARITQAYKTLGDPNARTNYDSRLAARARSRSTSESKQSADAPKSPASVDKLSIKDKAEESYQDGLAAVKSGESKKAISHFGFAAQACPNEARYRASYGQALAAFDNSRRQAEGELQAALKLEPNNPDYRIMLAQLYRVLGFAKRARAEAERALASAPNHQGARALLRDLA